MVILRVSCVQKGWMPESALNGDKINRIPGTYQQVNISSMMYFFLCMILCYGPRERTERQRVNNTNQFHKCKTKLSESMTLKSLPKRMYSKLALASIMFTSDMANNTISSKTNCGLYLPYKCHLLVHIYSCSRTAFLLVIERNPSLSLNQQ